MKFSKFNNPNRRKRKSIPKYSNEYMEERREDLRKLLSEAKTPAEEKQIIEAFNACYLK
jgi:hypothetical protein